MNPPTNLPPHSRVTRICAPLLVCLLGCLFVVGCYPRKDSTWQTATAQLRPVQEEVQIRLEQIPSGIRENPYAGIRAETPKGPVLLLVDTGTSLTLLRESRRNELKLRKLMTAPMEAGGEVRSELYQTSSLRVGSLEFTNETVAFIPDAQMDELTKNSGPSIDGILGATLLRRGEIEFQGRERILTIRPFERARIQNNDRSIPLILIPQSNTYAINLEVEGISGGRFLFDTGTNVDLVLDHPRPIARRVVETPQVGVWNYQSVHGLEEVRVYNLPFNVRGSGILFPEGSRVFLSTQRNGPLDGIVGVPVLWRSPHVLLNSEKQLAAFLDSAP